MSETNLVIDSTAGNLDSGRKFVEIVENTALHGIKFVYLGENEISPDIVQYIFKELEKDGKVALTDDYDNDIEYISISDMSHNDTNTLTNMFNSHFNIKKLDEIKEMLINDLENNSKYLIHLGLMEPQGSSDEKTIRIVQSTLLSSHVGVILKGITALQLINLRGFRKDIKILAETSDDPKVRRSAALALAQLKA